MRIVGVTVAGGPKVVDCLIGHGEDPVWLLRRAGYELRRPLSVTGQWPEIILTALVSRSDRPGRGRPRLRRPHRTEALSAPRHQRLAAYAIVLSDRGLLATQFSSRTAVAGLWGLPGGGIKPGETAAEAVVREAMEETGQTIQLERIIDIQSDHWVGDSPAGITEDFHALRLIYLANVTSPSDPVVHDAGGTTAAARWIALPHWRRTAWSVGFRAILTRHLGRRHR